eukprot:8081997-Alexandrium_andersonii.AAC.1
MTLARMSARGIGSRIVCAAARVCWSPSLCLSQLRANSLPPSFAGRGMRAPLQPPGRHAGCALRFLDSGGPPLGALWGSTARRLSRGLWRWASRA